MAQQSSVKQPEYDIAKVFKEIHDDSDRAAAITGVAYFEEILVLAITARLVDLSNTRKDALFNEEKGPLNTFYARVLMGYALGLYGPKTFADLNKIRNIRNKFAHRPGISKFDHPTVSRLCNDLFTAANVRATMNPRADPSGTPRALYLDSLLEIGARLMRSGPRQPNHLPLLNNGLL